MQNELDAEAPGAFRLISVNGAGYESGNDGFLMGKTTPLLQDTTAVNAWQLWGVEYRDVVIVDGLGRRREVYNLTVNDLSVPANASALKQKLRDAR